MKNGVHISDEELIVRIKTGDDRAFRLLFDRYYKRALNTINKYVKDEHTAEDLAQTIFVRLWNKKEKIDIQGLFSPYFRRACVNESINYIKSNKHFLFLEPDNRELELGDYSAEDQEVYWEQEQRESKLSAAINTLPEKCRVVFLLNRIDGLSHKEISQQLDISTKTIENHMTKALKLLRDAMLNNPAILALIIFLKIF
jgi:RNA polymerase sigma-70 factor, ECF subfamily